jgi:group I intron endonuclease
MDSGIYKIENQVNDKVYIGKSVDVQKRLWDHKSYLRNDNHQNPHLQNSYNKYGEKNFNFQILLYCGEDNLAFYEQRAMDEYESYNRDKGYNIVPKSDHSEMSEEHKKKISKALEGIERSEEFIQKLKDRDKHGFEGKSHSDEWKEYMSDLKSGKGHHMYGKTHSKESKRKMSENRKGEDNENSKLSKQQVLNIRRAYKENFINQIDLSEIYNISQRMISLIVRKESWNHLED